MPQTPEAEAFIKRIIALPKGPGVSLDEALQPSIDDEAELRKLWATDKDNARLKDPFVGLVDVFDAPSELRTTRARVPKDEEDLSAKHVMPLSEENRRKEGSPSTVADLEEWKKNWSIFTEGSLSQLVDWDNVVAAGGAVQAALLPLSEKEKESKRAIRKHYHSAAYPTSDVDLFLYGMDKEQAEKKIIQIYEAVRDSVPWDVTCIRTKHTVSIHSQYPYRSVQIVLRLYSSPAEILAGFDIDAPCCLFNGQRIYANPRAIVAMMRQSNTVDMTRRSPSYEVRLAKYSMRGFEVYVPGLERGRVDPTIYERSISRIEGLARLLVLEKLYSISVRSKFIESRRSLRGRPYIYNQKTHYRNNKKHKGDLKFDGSVIGLEMNDYDVASLHVPYGPGWNARRIEKLVWQTDLGMNSTFNPKNKDRRLHRHPAFFGTIQECLDDCCECCPEPIDDDERTLQKEEDEMYIRGRISFIEEDPGRQSMTGSFNPIDVGEWSAQVYVGENEAFFRAIAAHDRVTVQAYIAKAQNLIPVPLAPNSLTPSSSSSSSSESDPPKLQPEFDLNRRDHVGRTALHLALLVRDEDIAMDLIEGGAKMMWRLSDGRNALHLAAQYDLPMVIRKMMERSKRNEEEGVRAGLIKKDEEKDEKMDVDKKGGALASLERPSSEDDWSSADDGVVPMDTDMSGEDDEADDEDGFIVEDGDDDIGDEDDDDGGSDSGEKKEASKKEPEDPLAEDDAEQPDVLDINMPDWDLGWTPICHAVFSGSVDSIEELVKAGADPTLLSSGRDTHVHPLTVAVIREDDEGASKVSERLLLAGASSSTADSEMKTIFHHAVQRDRLKLVATLLRCDPNAGKVLNFPSFKYLTVQFPLLTALQAKHYAMVATLLAHGAKVTFTEDDITQGMEASDANIRSRYFQNGAIGAVNCTYRPVETAIANHDDLVKVLIAIGADFNIGIRAALQQYNSSDDRLTLIDWVRKAIEHLEEKESAIPEDAKKADKPAPFKLGSNPSSWKTFVTNALNDASEKDKYVDPSAEQKKPAVDREQIARRHAIQYLKDAEQMLAGLGAKTWDDLFPEKPYEKTLRHAWASYNNPNDKPKEPEEIGYMRFSPTSYTRDIVPQSLATLYDELFEACYTGNRDKVQQMCLPREGSGVTPLNINACVTDHTAWNMRSGFTPLYAAIKRRQWNTAKLIIAISVAQYKPSDKREKKFMKKLVFDDDDSDDESLGSEDTDDTAAQEERFIDVAQKRSSVESDVHPRDLINNQVKWHKWNEEGKTWQVQNTNMLVQAVVDDDFEAFVNIANLYKSCPLSVTLDGHIFDTILQNDRPDMLDEYIRRTGRNIDLKAHREGDEPDLPGAINDQNKLYLGLKVHGKKRADLAKADDPNAVYLGNDSPLVWQAASGKARKILAYLATDKPLAAYKYYSSTHGDELAYQIRRFADLEQKMPALLGWIITDIGDSPLTAAILSNDLPTVKDLFKIQPKLMSKALKTTVKFINYNPINLAVRHGESAALVDFLLAQGVSPTETDSVRGWNIYHQICESNHADLFEHLLKKLPREANEAMLCQQSKHRLNTPLHIAIKAASNAKLRIVKLIAEYTKLPLLMRDVDGSTPIHKAVQAGLHKTVKILLDNMPTEGLFLENGVGETIIDMAILARAFELLAEVSNGVSGASTMNRENYPTHPLRVDISLLERELPKLKQVMEDLHTAGRLVKDSTLTKELMKFVTTTESRLKDEKKAEEERIEVVDEEEEKKKEKNPWDAKNVKETLTFVKDAILAVGPDAWRKRDLVHLVDVQRSVQGNLVESDGTTGRPKVTVVDVEGGDLADGLGEADEATERDSSMVLKQVYIRPDTY